MGMLTLLAKLEALKEFVTNEVPEALDWSANLLNQAAEGCTEAANFLRNLGDGKVTVTGDEAKAWIENINRLEQLETSFATARSKQYNRNKMTTPAETGNQGMLNRALAASLSDLLIAVIQDIRLKIENRA